MKKRFSMNRRKDRRTFSRTRRVMNSKNKITIQRGGVRF